MKDRTRKALEDLLGQVVQARDGFGIYQQSKSMDSAVTEAEAALAEPTSAEGGATVPSERDKRYAPSLEQEAGATPSGPKETSVDVPLCGNHAEWWFCERNHLPQPNEPCVVCAMLPESDLRVKLESLRELSEKATAGEWQAKTFCSPPDGAYIVDGNGHLLIGAAKKITVWDSRFIVACVNAVRAILEGKD